MAKVLDDLVARGANPEFIRIVSVVCAPPALEKLSKYQGTPLLWLACMNGYTPSSHKQAGSMITSCLAYVSGQKWHLNAVADDAPSHLHPCCSYLKQTICCLGVG